MNNHRKCRGWILTISDRIFPTQQSTKSTFWTEHFINNHNQQNQHFGRKFPNPCITQAIYITTYRLVERGYERSAEWVRAECGERERESRVSSLVDPSENGGGPVSGGEGRQRMEP
ncbi:hypothetical protein TIFTF001_030417 [Ficus carica]|uniref:Uncharacterized protein n=1 Tax=Ficus carica TaxID=3494 RepID=A0AA88DU28_FICCA|nr:hypothetical protein TIFTF001_030352 [Ficus carica]GMN61326.1 hypothetical protein TIFTF001_030417 [Ficus carica]